MTENIEKRIGNLFGCTGGNFAGNVYDQEYLAPALLTAQGGAKAANDNHKNERREH